MKVEHYMARPAELEKHQGVVEMFQTIAQASDLPEQQRNIFLALWSFWNFEHAFDDVLDAGNLVEAERIELLRECSEFIHAALLTPEANGAVIAFKTRYLAALAKSGLPDEELAAQAFDDFTGNLWLNPVYTEFAASHRAMFDMMIFRAIAGDEMAGSLIEARRVLSPAVRCGDLDFIVHVAQIAGGWDFARKMSSLRDYDQRDAEPV